MHGIHVVKKRPMKRKNLNFPSFYNINARAIQLGALVRTNVIGPNMYSAT